MAVLPRQARKARVMAVTAEPYCRSCACLVTPTQVERCCNRECPLRVRQSDAKDKRRVAQHYCKRCACHVSDEDIESCTDRGDCDMRPLKDYGPAGPEYVGLTPKRPFDDGMAEFAREVQKLLARARKSHAEAFAAMLRIAAEEIDPVKDAGE